MSRVYVFGLNIIGAESFDSSRFAFKLKMQLLTHKVFQNQNAIEHFQQPIFHKMADIKI